MSTQDNINLVKAFFDAINQHDADRAASFVDPSAEWVTALSPSGAARGQDALKQSMLNYWTAFPDNRVEMTNMIATEDWVTVEYIGRGTHNGPFNTPFGQVPPTGRKMETRFCDVYQIKNGKIAKCDNYFDTAAILQQLGVMPRIGQTGGMRM